ASGLGAVAIRRVAMVEHQSVAVRVLEGGAVADAGVERLTEELDADIGEPFLRLVDVGDSQDDRRERQRRKRLSGAFRVDDRERDVVRFELDPRVCRVRVALQPERLLVELRRPPPVFRRHCDEVDAPCVDQPTEPSICSWISRFISTAYSSGSSFVIGSTKPETIIAEASVSESPRDIR